MAESIARKPFSGTSNQTKGFGQVMNEIVIVNDGNANLTFTVNSETWTLGPGAVFDEELDPFSSVTIAATGSYYGYARRSKAEVR